MSERPIIFSSPMVRAILKGNKTQTRRIMRPQPIVENPSDERVAGWGRGVGKRVPCWPGDTLWVRETWALEGDNFADGYQPGRCDALFRATTPHAAMWRWRPSIHLPRKYARLFLRVIDVRAERLHWIGYEGAVAEGVKTVMELGPEGESPRDYVVRMRATWKKLWDSINGKRASWESNPWVWVIEFERAN